MAVDSGTSTPYSTTSAFITAPPTWLNAYDAARLGAYVLYDNIYRNDPQEYKLVLRGSEDFPIYLPSGKKLVNVLKRYIGRNIGFSVSGVEDASDTGGAYTDVVTVIGNLFKRERLASQFNQARNQMLKFGDGCLYLSADPNKPEGSRLTIVAIDPGTYFPIFDERNVDKVVGCDIVERITNVTGDKVTVQRQRYLKRSHPLHPAYNPDAPDDGQTPIVYEFIELEEDDWEDPEKAKPIRTITPMTEIPGIFQLPVYHFKAQADVGDPFGTSYLAGFERIILDRNQTITDQSVAIALAGLGMYRSDSRPVDDDGNDTGWIIGPNRVVETPPGGIFERIPGVGSITPSLEHMRFLEDEMFETVGVSDVALGQVDTSMAESGIALSIRFAPLLDQAAEENQMLTDVMNQFFYDLKNWIRQYEGVDLEPAVIEVSFETGVPVDKEKESNRLQDLFVNGVISKDYYRKAIAQLFGYKFPEGMDAQIAAERAAEDPYASDAPPSAGSVIPEEFPPADEEL